MHELGVVMEVVKVVEKFAKENKVSEIDALVLQIGEYSSMIPKYILDIFPMATEGTILEESDLEIQVVEGQGFFIKEIRAL